MQQLDTMLALIDSYLSGQISAEELMMRYFDIFRDDPPTYAAHRITSRIFLDLDEYTPDLIANTTYLITEEELRRRLLVNVEELRKVCQTG